MNVIVGGRQSGKTTALVAAAKAALARGENVVVFAVTEVRRRKLVEVHGLPETATAVIPTINLGQHQPPLDRLPYLMSGSRTFLALDDADEFLNRIFRTALNVVAIAGELGAPIVRREWSEKPSEKDATCPDSE